MAQIKDTQHPFFRPLWRRIAIVVVCLVWAGLEYIGGSASWGTIALAAAVYGAWQYLYLYKPGPESVPSPDAVAPVDGVQPADSEPKG
ncbi:MAG TPA: DUF3329 domain-containing protein [Mesorhizobium sp.]|jgi:hypothetical protein